MRQCSHQQAAGDSVEQCIVMQERRVSPLEAGGTLKGAEAAGKVSTPLLKRCLDSMCILSLFAHMCCVVHSVKELGSL